MMGRKAKFRRVKCGKISERDIPEYVASANRRWKRHYEVGEIDEETWISIQEVNSVEKLEDIDETEGEITYVCEECINNVLFESLGAS